MDVDEWRLKLGLVDMPKTRHDKVLSGGVVVGSMKTRKFVLGSLRRLVILASACAEVWLNLCGSRCHVTKLGVRIVLC